jgi:hypothetical protein
MPDDPIDQIRASRDEALQALDAAFNAIGREVARTTKTGPYLDRLTDRYDDLDKERSAILEGATDAVLALPEVVAAAAKLGGLSSQMTRTAAALPNATAALNTATAILSLGQRFVDLIATCQKG